MKVAEQVRRVRTSGKVQALRAPQDRDRAPRAAGGEDVDALWRELRIEAHRDRFTALTPLVDAVRERFITVAEADAAVRAFCRVFRDEWIVDRLYCAPAEAYAAFAACGTITTRFCPGNRALSISRFRPEVLLG